MAEALAVAGVVSNIVQLVDFGSKVLGRLDDFQSSLGETPKVFRHIKTELPILLDTLKQTKLAVEKGSVKDETKNALIPVVDGCRAQIELLDGIIGKVVPLTGDSWRRKGSKAIASLWQDSKVKNITAVLRNYIQTLTYYHAASSSRLHVVNSMTTHLDHVMAWTTCRRKLIVVFFRSAIRSVNTILYRTVPA